SPGYPAATARTAAHAWRRAAPALPGPFAASATRPRRAPCTAADVQRDGTCVRPLPGTGRPGDQQLPRKPRYDTGESPGGSAHIAGRRYAALATALCARD